MDEQFVSRRSEHPASEASCSRPWKTLALPSELIRIPSMLTDEEKQYLVWLTSVSYEGWGSIVDLGPWLGSSSAALAEGLKRRGTGGQVYSIDLFRWDPSYMETFAKEDLRRGDDFLPVFMREIGEYSQWIVPLKQDLMQYQWQEGAIEILFVDAAKSWDLLNNILEAFGKYLVPGHSRIVLQDFKFPLCHWLPLVFDSRPDLWMEVESVDIGHTVSFIPRKTPKENAALHYHYSDDSFPIEMAEQVLRNRMAHEDPEDRHLLLRTLYRKALLDGTPEAAKRIKEELLLDWSRLPTPDELRTIEDVTDLVLQRGWKAFERGDYHASKAQAERCLGNPSCNSLFGLALLGTTLVKLNDFEGARHCAEELVRLYPQAPEGQLLTAEIALIDNRSEVTEACVLAVLREPDVHRDTLRNALSLLHRAWDSMTDVSHHLEVLSPLTVRLAGLADFWITLACEQYKTGARDSAREALERALALDPDNRWAAQQWREWKMSESDRGMSTPP